jgi:hypothetical protein
MNYNKKTCICGIEITTKFHKQHYKSKYHISKVGNRVNPWHEASKINEEGKMYTPQELYEMSDKKLSLKFFENFYDKCSNGGWVKTCRFCGLSQDGGKRFGGDDTACKSCKVKDNKQKIRNNPSLQIKLKKYHKDRRDKLKSLRS